MKRRSHSSQGFCTNCAPPNAVCGEELKGFRDEPAKLLDLHEKLGKIPIDRSA